MRFTYACLIPLMLLLIPMFGFGAATITGKVTYTGTPPEQKAIDMAKEPSCAEQYQTPPKQEKVVTGSDNTLGNVVVYISAGEKDEKAAPEQAVVLQQKGCRYHPHILVLQVNQELKITNDDHVNHNIHPLAKTNPEWNRLQPPHTVISDTYHKEEFIHVKCDIHAWMNGVFAVLKTTHYSVTSADGNFSLPDLPPGNYTITAWHETFGTQTQEVSVTGDETKTISFTFKASAN